MTASIMTVLSQMTGIPEGILNWLVGTFGLAALTQVWAFIQMPRQVKKMREALVEQNQLLKTRVFPKIARVENFLIDNELRMLGDDEELPEILQEMRKDQYPDADLRDKELAAKKRQEYEASLT